MRIQVKRFAEQMEKKLKQNDHKGGYQNCTYEYLYMRMQQEMTELFQALFDFQNNTIAPDDYVRRNAIINECSDVANFAMMIADKFLKREVGGRRGQCCTG